MRSRKIVGVLGGLVLVVGVALLVLAPRISQVLEKREMKAGMRVSRELTTAVYASALSNNALSISALSISAGDSVDFPANVVRVERVARFCAGEGWQRVGLADLRPSLFDRSLLSEARRLGVHLELRCDPAGVAVELASGSVRWEDGYVVRRPRGLGG